MAVDTLVNIIEDPGLADLLVDVYPFDDAGYGTIAASDQDLPESGSIDGVYTLTISTALEGLHRLHIKSAGQVIAILEVILYDITDTLTAVEVGTAEALQAAAYPGRSIFIDTVNGVSGTCPGVNGTERQPVASWADAITIADLLGYNQFYVIGGSTLTLSSSAADYNFDGENYAFYPNGQSISGATIRNALVYMSVSSATNSTTWLIGCRIQQLITGSLGINVRDSVFISSSTHALDGACKFYNCRCDTLQNNPPIFDFQGSGGLPYTTAIFMDWIGDLRLKQVYAAATVHIYGTGDLTIDADCTGGYIKVVGMRPPIDNVTGGFDNLTFGTLDYEPIPADMTRINGQPDPAQTMQEIHEYVPRLTVVASSFTRTVTEFETDGTDEADDTLKGKTISWFNPSGAPANTGQYFILSSQGTINNTNGKVKITLDPLRPLDAVPAVGDVIRILGARSQ